MNDTELPPTPWNIGEPGGPSGPFYSLVAVNGNVIAMQIAERRYAELFAAAPDAQAENAKLRDELVKAAQLMREIRDAKNMHELNAALDAGSLSLSAADAAAEPREANVGLEVQNATLRERVAALEGALENRHPRGGTLVFQVVLTGMHATPNTPQHEAQATCELWTHTLRSFHHDPLITVRVEENEHLLKARPNWAALSAGSLSPSAAEGEAEPREANEVAALEGALRGLIFAPSGKPICACKRPGLDRNCGYCVAQSLLPEGARGADTERE